MDAAANTGSRCVPERAERRRRRVQARGRRPFDEIRQRHPVRANARPSSSVDARRERMILSLSVARGRLDRLLATFERWARCGGPIAIPSADRRAHRAGVARRRSSDANAGCGRTRSNAVGTPRTSGDACACGVKCGSRRAPGLFFRQCIIVFRGGGRRVTRRATARRARRGRW